MNSYKEKDQNLFAEVAKLMNGDESSYQKIYELSEKYIYKIIHDIVKDHHTTEDIMQDTYVQIYNKINTLQSASAFYVWAGRIATNFTLRHIQKNRREVIPMADEEGSTDFVFEKATDDTENFIPENVLMDREKQRLIGEIVDRLSVEQKLSVQYFYYEEMSVSEIAQAMGCSTGTVKSRLNYARKSIKEAVIDLDVNQGTRLYSLAAAPLFLMAFRVGVEDFIAATVGTATAAGAVSMAGAASGNAAVTSGASVAGEAAVSGVSVIGEASAVGENIVIGASVVEEAAVTETIAATETVVASEATIAAEAVVASEATVAATTVTTAAASSTVAAKVAIVVGAVALTGGGATTAAGIVESVSNPSPVVEEIELEENETIIDLGSVEVKIELPPIEDAPEIDIYVESQPDPEPQPQENINVVIPEEEEPEQEETTQEAPVEQGGSAYGEKIPTDVDVHYADGSIETISYSEYENRDWSQYPQVEYFEKHYSMEISLGG